MSGDEAPVSVVPFTRHRKSCPSVDRGEFFPRCDCPKFLRYYLNGRLRRPSAQTRTWSVAEEKAVELQTQLEKGNPITVRRETENPTIEQLVVTFIAAKQSEGVSQRRIKKLEYQLTCFERWMAERGRFYPHLITPTDLIGFRSSWDALRWQTTTKVKAQQNLRTFLRFCCRENLSDLLSTLKTIRLSKEDHERLEPKPFTEREIKMLLTQIPRTFSPERVAQATLLVKFMLSTGLAIRDTLQLKRKDISNGWLRINRQKTHRPVRQSLDPALCELLLLGEGEYVFWDGKFQVTSAVTAWQDDLRQLMQNAGLWIKGNTTHRFRDTAVDYWLGEGWSMTEVAAALGDTVAVTERHYASLASKRMESRLKKLPKRKWDV
jgi:integrase